MHDASVLVVGLVLGVGIFRTPQLVASNTASSTLFYAAWVLGGLLSLVGALCYAELASAYPSSGGDYHFVSRALGQRLGVLFGWARMLVLQTGSIAILAYVFADYAAPLVGLPRAATPWLAAAAVIALTAINLRGLRPGRLLQRALTSIEVVGLLVVVVAGLVVALARGTPVAAAPPAPASWMTSFGVAMIFVLLTFGGWSEAAYLSGEVRNPRKDVSRALFIGIGVITVLYLLTNVAYIGALGRAGVAASPTVAADVMARAIGRSGALFVSLVVVVSALSSANATMITGARSNFAVGRDVRSLSFLANWVDERQTPRNALLVQGGIAVALVAFGAVTRSGFETMVAYTAPVFWLMLLLVGASLFSLRIRDPATERPFRVPLYPVTPALFCLASAGMLVSSVAFAGPGALLGLAVMASGIPVVLLASTGNKTAEKEPSPA